MMERRRVWHAVNESSKQRESIGAYVIVVDDDRDHSDVVCEVLANLGHRALAVYDGASALALLDEKRPDLLLVDLKLPDVTGFDLASDARRRFGAEIHIVAVTGHSGSDIRALATSAGCDDILVKPFPINAIVAILEKVGRT